VRGRISPRYLCRLGGSVRLDERAPPWYVSGRSRGDRESERELFAPMGAKKPYEAIKHKKVTDVTWVKALRALLA